MKKITTFLLGLTLASSASFGQVLIDEDFEGTFPPTGWTTADEDGRAADPAFIFSSNWETLLFNNGFRTAVDASVGSPAGPDSDWMITSAQTIPSTAGSSTLLNFNIISLTNAPDFPDQSTIEVRISTNTNSTTDFTDLLTVAQTTAANQFQFRSIDLTSYAGQTIYIAFVNVTDGGFALGVDDVLLTTVPNDAISLAGLTFDDYSTTAGETVTITGVVTNEGAREITSFDVSWSENGGTPNTENITGTIPPFSSVQFSHNTRLTGGAVGTATPIEVTVSNPNGNTDPDVSDNTMSTDYVVANGTTVAKNSVLEEFTTARCQFCPDGQVIVDYMLENNDDVIAYGVHSCFNTDGMTNDEATDICNTLGNFSAPSAMVDRYIFSGTNPTFGRTPPTGQGNDQSPWNLRANERADAGAPTSVVISGNYDRQTRQVDVKVSTSFVDLFPGDVRVSLVIVEDSVAFDPNPQGYDGDWDQVNAYYAVQGHPFFNVGTPANAAQTISIINGYVHKHVMRDILPSTWGDGSNIPALSARAMNTAYDTDFSFTLDQTYDDKQVSFVALVSRFGGIDNSKYEILNAEEVKASSLFGVGIEENNSVVNNLEIYPNPSANVTKLKMNIATASDVELRLFDITGKELKYEDFGTMAAGNQAINLNVSDLANGFYFVNLKVGEETISRKISVNR